MVGWITTRKAGNRYASFRLRVLTYHEVLYAFRTLPAYIRTYHNWTADFLTRATEREIRREMRRRQITWPDCSPFRHNFPRLLEK